MNVSGARKTATRKLFWGTEDSDPDVPGSRKTATRMFRGHGRQRPGIILGHGRPPRPECTWGTEDRDPDIPGERKTTTKLDGGTGGVPSCTTIVPAVSGAEPPELDVPRMKKGRVSFFRRMRKQKRTKQSRPFLWEQPATGEVAFHSDGAVAMTFELRPVSTDLAQV